MGTLETPAAPALTRPETDSLARLLNAGAVGEDTAVSTYQPGMARLDTLAIALLNRRGLAQTALRDGPGGLQVACHWLTAAGIQRAQALQGGHG